MKYKRHEETWITCLLQQHFPLSNIASYNLARDEIMHLWDVQRRKRTIEAEKEKKRQLAKDAVLASNAIAVSIFFKLICLGSKKCSNMQKINHMHRYATIYTNMQNQICTSMHF